MPVSLRGAISTCTYDADGAHHDQTLQYTERFFHAFYSSWISLMPTMRLAIKGMSKETLESTTISTQRLCDQTGNKLTEGTRVGKQNLEESSRAPTKPDGSRKAASSTTSASCGTTTSSIGNECPERNIAVELEKRPEALGTVDVQDEFRAPWRSSFGSVGRGWLRQPTVASVRPRVNPFALVKTATCGLRMILGTTPTTPQSSAMRALNSVASRTLWCNWHHVARAVRKFD